MVDGAKNTDTTSGKTGSISKKATASNQNTAVTLKQASAASPSTGNILQQIKVAPPSRLDLFPWSEEENAEILSAVLKPFKLETLELLDTDKGRNASASAAPDTKEIPPSCIGVGAHVVVDALQRFMDKSDPPKSN